MSDTAIEAARMMDMLPDEDKNFAYEFIKKLVKAWDPDFTKVTPEEAKSLIQKTDKRRASYCEYYASKKWGAVDAYDFCLNSSALGLGGTVELIQAMVAHKEHPIPSPTEIDPTQTEA